MIGEWYRRSFPRTNTNSGAHESWQRPCCHFSQARRHFLRIATHRHLRPMQEPTRRTGQGNPSVSPSFHHANRIVLSPPPNSNGMNTNKEVPLASTKVTVFSFLSRLSWRVSSNLAVRVVPKLSDQGGTLGVVHLYAHEAADSDSEREWKRWYKNGCFGDCRHGKVREKSASYRLS